MNALLANKIILVLEDLGWGGGTSLESFSITLNFE